MALAWLMLGRFALGSRRMSRSQTDRTLLLWAIPLLIAPPMYSKDVYSYLAQSEISLQGLDPYKVGPATGLGLDHVFTLSVPSLWRETPAPYGPLFLWIGQSISAITGENIVWAVLFHRLIVLLGVGLIVWATPRLARRCGVAEVSALWLGATNPLLFMHLVAGIHNEALMLGLMLAGTEFALRGIAPDILTLPFANAALVAGRAVHAETCLPNMATEAFLSCLSKPALEAAARAEGVRVHPRGKDTRAALVERFEGGTYTYPGARFAPTAAERASGTARSCPDAGFGDVPTEDGPAPDDTAGRDGSFGEHDRPAGDEALSSGGAAPFRPVA